MFKICNTFILIVTFALSLQAQKNIISAGGNSTGTGGNVSFSIGQIDYLYNSNGSFSVSQGLQQVYNLTLTSVRNNFVEDDRNINIYPNPTRDGIYISFQKYNEASYVIYDLTGNLISNNIIENASTYISLNQLPAATYIILITQTKMQQKSYQIVKL